MFALTAALLLLYDASYSELAKQTIEFAREDVEPVAQCIQYRLPSLLRDVGVEVDFRERLGQFVGIRLTGASAATTEPARTPT